MRENLLNAIILTKYFALRVTGSVIKFDICQMVIQKGIHYQCNGTDVNATETLSKDVRTEVDLLLTYGKFIGTFKLLNFWPY